MKKLIILLLGFFFLFNSIFVNANFSDNLKYDLQEWEYDYYDTELIQCPFIYEDRQCSTNNVFYYHKEKPKNNLYVSIFEYPEEISSEAFNAFIESMKEREGYSLSMETLGEYNYYSYYTNESLLTFWYNKNNIIMMKHSLLLDSGSDSLNFEEQIEISNFSVEDSISARKQYLYEYPSEVKKEFIENDLFDDLRDIEEWKYNYDDLELIQCPLIYEDRQCPSNRIFYYHKEKPKNNLYVSIFEYPEEISSEAFNAFIESMKEREGYSLSMETLGEYNYYSYYNTEHGRSFVTIWYNKNKILMMDHYYLLDSENDSLSFEEQIEISNSSVEDSISIRKRYLYEYPSEVKKEFIENNTFDNLKYDLQEWEYDYDDTELIQCPFIYEDRQCSTNNVFYYHKEKPKNNLYVSIFEYPEEISSEAFNAFIESMKEREGYSLSMETLGEYNYYSYYTNESLLTFWYNKNNIIMMKHSLLLDSGSDSLNFEEQIEISNFSVEDSISARKQYLYEYPSEVKKIKEVDLIEEACTNSCFFEGKCLPLGYRIDDSYCSINLSMVVQLETGRSCENDFECKSNFCLSNECVDSNLFMKIIQFFKKIFGF